MRFFNTNYGYFKGEITQIPPFLGLGGTFPQFFNIFPTAAVFSIIAGLKEFYTICNYKNVENSVERIIIRINVENSVEKV